MNIWSKDGNTCLSIRFDKFNFKNIFRISSNNAIKGVNSFIEKNFWIFGFKFTYINVNYDNIVFVKLNTKDNYTKSKNHHEIEVLKETLVKWVKDNVYMKETPPFNWNFMIDDDNYIFFLTGEKKWFEKNNLNDLIPPFREIIFDKYSTSYFPRYNPLKTNEVKYIN